MGNSIRYFVIRTKLRSIKTINSSYSCIYPSTVLFIELYIVMLYQYALSLGAIPYAANRSDMNLIIFLGVLR